MIEKKIHCIWLGGEKTPLARECRASWEKFAPEWKIVECNEIPPSAPKFVEAAAMAGKWAFVSDWLRFWLLEREGGVYFDFDVELVRPLDEGLRDLRLEGVEWCATERLKNGNTGLNPGAGIYLEKGSAIAGKMLAVYEGEIFDGNTTVGDLMSAHGIAPREVPMDVFSPYDWRHNLHRTERTIGIHHYALSWITPRRRVARWLSWHGMGWLVNGLLAARNIFREKRH